MKKKHVKMNKKLLVTLSSMVLLPFSLSIAPISMSSNSTNEISVVEVNESTKVVNVDAKSILQKAKEIANSTDNSASNVKNSNVDTPLNVTRNNETITKKGYIPVPIGDTGIYLKVPNFEEDKEKAQKVYLSYANKPSGIVTEKPKFVVSSTPDEDKQKVIDKISSNNVFSFLEFDEKKWCGIFNETNYPTIFNLGIKTSYKNNKSNVIISGTNKFSDFTDEELVGNVSLPAFDKENDNIQPINQEYLDQNGVLALQITLTSQTSQSNKTTYYILMSGFGSKFNKNSGSDQPMLPAENYTSSVNEVSDELLLNNIVFENDVNLQKKIVPGSRVNQQLQGTVTFDADFSWTIPENIKFRNDFAGIIPIDRTQSSSPAVDETLKYNANNEVRHMTNWQKQFSFTGFQPAPELSTGALIGLLVGIIGSIFITAFIAFIVVKITKPILNKKRL